MVTHLMTLTQYKKNSFNSRHNLKTPMSVQMSVQITNIFIRTVVRSHNGTIDTRPEITTNNIYGEE